MSCRKRLFRTAFLIAVLIAPKVAVGQVIISTSTGTCVGTPSDFLLGYSYKDRAQKTDGDRSLLRCPAGCYAIAIGLAYRGAIERVSITCNNGATYGPVSWSGCCKDSTVGGFSSSSGFSYVNVYFGNDVNALSVRNYGATSGYILGCGGSACQTNFYYDCGGSIITGVEVYQNRGSNNWIQAFQPICTDMTCPDTAKLDKGICVPYTPCVSGQYYAGENICVSCPVGQTSAAGYARGCTACPSATNGVYFNRAGDCATTQCSAGTYSSSIPSTACIKCWSNSNSPQGASSCTCNAGYYNAGASCLTCIAGSACSGDGNSNTCNPGSYSLAGASACTSCVAGTHTPGSASTACLSCPSGKYSGGSGATVCVVCGFGEYSASSSSTRCTACSTGSYTTARGSTACLQCSAGSYSISTLDTACTQCGVGTYASGLAATQCIECAMGAFSSAPSTALCSPCPPGSFSKTTATSACTICPAGTVSPTPGMNYCRDCGPGTFSSNSIDCGQCTPGTYSDYAGAITCNKCSKGLYSTAIGMTDGSLCASCEPGTYGGRVGATACSPCAVGTSTNLYATVDRCGVCPGNYYAKTPGMVTCEPCTPRVCPAGERLIACTTTTDSRCEACPLIDNCVYVLPNGCVNKNGDSTCFCKEGYEVVNKQCRLCVEGTFKADISDNPCIPWTRTSCALQTQYLANGTAYHDAECLPCPEPPPNTEVLLSERCGWKCKAGFER